eukprot:scaffold35693_cov129-Isochrysis_galbana.AAC.3
MSGAARTPTTTKEPYRARTSVAQSLNLETRFSYNYKKSTFTKTDGRVGGWDRSSLGLGGMRSLFVHVCTAQSKIPTVRVVSFRFRFHVSSPTPASNIDRHINSLWSLESGVAPPAMQEGLVRFCAQCPESQ